MNEENNSNRERSIHALETKASHGDAQAQYEIGAAYHDGDGVPQDLERAVHWYARACEQGHAEALFRLGMLRGAGKGCHADQAEAQRLLRQAADQGHKLAQVVSEQLAEIDEAARKRMGHLGLG